MNLSFFNPAEKFCAGFVESGALREVIDKDICINKYPLPFLYLVEVQVLYLLWEELRLKGYHINNLAAFYRDNTACGYCRALDVSGFFYNDVNSFMLFKKNLLQRLKDAVFINGINYFRHNLSPVEKVIYG